VVEEVASGLSIYTVHPGTISELERIIYPMREDGEKGRSEDGKKGRWKRTGRRTILIR
jgi:hypothetical protein